MNTNGAGATPQEWLHFDLVLGWGPDLLPAVCEPGRAIAARSTLTSYGKVPSVLNAQGEVVGLTQWPMRVSSDAEITRWSKNPAYGICLQTRRIRALDVDVTDPLLARQIEFWLHDWAETRGFRWPIRSRDDSPKFLLLFELPGEYGKQRLETDGGVIEFLATGQQCVIAGRHPSGERYQWSTGLLGRSGVLPSTIPSLTPLQFTELMIGLEIEFGSNSLVDGTCAVWSEPSLRASRGAQAAVALDALDDRDDVVAFLRGRVGPDGVRGPGATAPDGRPWLVSHSPDGRLHVRCPWASAHTSGVDATATSYFPAGTGGYETGSFCCLHAHCADRSTGAWLDAIGWTLDGFDRVEDGSVPARAVDGHSPWVDADQVCRQCGERFGCTHTEQAEGHAVDDTAVEAVLGALGVADPYDLVGDDPAVTAAKRAEVHPMEMPRFDRSKDGRIKPSLHNAVLALRRPDVTGATIERDAYTDTVTIRLGEADRRPFKDSDYTRLNLKLVALGFGPAAVSSQMLREAVGFVADERTFDSAIEWLRGLPPWDGVPRVASFCTQYLGCAPSPYVEAVSRYWWTAHAGRVLSPGIQADMAIVLIGEQGTGKTSAIKAIVPSLDHYVEIDLMERDGDLSRSMRGKLIGELAELRGINSREIESIKAWVSRQHECWTPKYCEFSRTFPRRLVLVGTSNQEEFLADETGNRRWLPVVVGEAQDRDGIRADRDQLWAEARALFEQHGVVWQEAERLARAEHARHRINDVWEEVIRGWLLRPDLSGAAPACRDFLHVNDILKEAVGIDPKYVKVSEQHRVGRILRAMGYQKHQRRVDGHLTKVWERPVDN